MRDVELGTELRGRRALRLLVQAHVRARGTGDVGPAVVLRAPGVGRPRVLLRQRRPRRLPFLTIFGRIGIERTSYAAGRGASVCPLDKDLQLPARAYSHVVQYRLVKRAVQSTFREAADGLREETGESIPVRSAEAILADGSVDFDAFYAWRRRARLGRSGPILVVAIDGKGIPMVKPEKALRVVRRGKGEKANKKRMATVGTVFTMEPRVRTPLQVVQSLFKEVPKRPRRDRHGGPQQKRVWASLLSGKDAFVQDMVAEVERRDPRHRRTWVVVCDGERALQYRMGRALPDAVLVLDFIHALEKLWLAAYVFHPEGSPEAQEFVRDRALRVLEGRVSQVVGGLRQMAKKHRIRGAQRKTLLGVASYLGRNRTRMRYHEYLAKGLPIASGCVEGACKNLVKDRMERSGMRWSLRTAEAMLRMRAVYLSGDLDEYWDFHVAREQERLHGGRVWRPVKGPAKR